MPSESGDRPARANFTELRVGHLDANAISSIQRCRSTMGAATITGRFSHQRSGRCCPKAQEHVPLTENIRALRAALNTLGPNGFCVEAIDDSTLLAIAAAQPQI